MKRVLKHIVDNHYKNISVVGLSKNAGKTVALNGLLEYFFEAGIRLGLTSSGRDGERKDVLTNTEKPGIFVVKGTLFSTTDALYKKAKYPAEILYIGEEKTPLGRVLLARAMEDSFIEIAGLQSNSGLNFLCDKMISLGANYCFIDGSINRQASASPQISDACILSVGAAYSRSMDKTVEIAAHTVNMFRIKEVNSEIRKVLLPVFNKCCFIEEKEVKVIEQLTALNAGANMAKEINSKTKYVYIPGALVFNTLESILKKNRLLKQCTIVVQDPTKIFLTPKEYLWVQKQGIEIQVFKEMKLLGVTINPYAPAGYFYNGNAFMEMLSKRISRVPIYDIIRNEVIVNEM